MALVDVVKFNGNPELFAWKYPNSELGTWTQLIVNETQEAILFKGGQALDVFQAGRHTLSTANIPLLNKIINLPFGGKSPFSAEIWFVNKIHSLDIKWGTPSPIQLQDPKYKIFVPVRSYGQFGVQITDSKKFLLKLVGTVGLFNKDNLVKFFRGLFLTKVKDSISTYLVKKEISTLEINAYLDELSEHLKERIAPTLDDYGIGLVNFYVNDISIPEDDSGVKKLKEALAKKAEMDIVGYNYVQERSFNTLEGAATNPGSAQSAFMGAGIGLGLGAGIGGEVGKQVGGISKNLNIKEVKTCPQCNAELTIDQQFCHKCGFDTLKKNKEEHNITCSNCGHKYNSNTKFCPNCGDSYKPCPSCGADLKPGQTACHVCGKNAPRTCVKCGFLITNEKINFCPECGESLVKKCPDCGLRLEGEPKFCPECGKKLKGE